MEREEATGRCKAVVERIQSLSLSKITSSCKSTLLRLANSELNFLSRSSSLSTSSSLSCNVGYIEAIVHILEQPYITGVSRVCKAINLSSKTSCIEKDGITSEVAHIDIVCSFHKHPTWFIVSSRNPKYISWDDSGRNKGLKVRIEQIIRAAHSSEALMPTFVVLFFANGLEIATREKLVKDFGFRDLELGFSHFGFGFVDEVEGDWINVLANLYRKASTLIMGIGKSPSAFGSVEYMVGLSSTGADKEFTGKYNELSCGSSFHSLIMEMKEWPLDVKDMPSRGRADLSRHENLINFDTTALIAIVSGISNGAAEKLLATPENELRKRFKNNTEFVISQALSEIRSPFLAELSHVLSEKRGIVCESVHLEFMELVSMYGGPNERIRADQLAKRLKIVPDSPSSRVMCLPTTRKLALKNKVTFGTGDYWGAPTLTANMGFVRAVSQTGMSLFAIEHRPRALVGD